MDSGQVLYTRIDSVIELNGICNWNIQESPHLLCHFYYYSNIIKYYSLSQDNFNKVKFSEPASNPLFYFQTFEFGFERYQPKYYGDTLSGNIWQTQYDYKMDVGIVNVFFDETTMSSIVLKLKLLEHNK
jgi:hypothetical protein